MAEQSQSGILFRVGISKDSIISIFSNFIKEARDPSRFSEGRGLGLSIAKSMTEALGGTMPIYLMPISQFEN